MLTLSSQTRVNSKRPECGQISTTIDSGHCQCAEGVVRPQEVSSAETSDLRRSCIPGRGGCFFHPDIHVLVIGALRQQGRQIDNGLLKHVAPVHWNHINLTGDYSPQNKRVRKADSGHSESEPNLNVPFPLSSNAPYSSPRRPNSLTETRNADRSEEDASFAGKALGGVPAETRSA
jgi:Tn3 transposase DDE domain